jgi:DNA-directed RNA polymerase subunit RPC12/RpoP
MRVYLGKETANMTCWKKVTVTKTLLTRHRNTVQEDAECPKCGHQFKPEETAWSHTNGKFGCVKYYCEACYPTLWI